MTASLDEVLGATGRAEIRELHADGALLVFVDGDPRLAQAFAWLEPDEGGSVTTASELRPRKSGDQIDVVVKGYDADSQRFLVADGSGRAESAGFFRHGDVCLGRITLVDTRGVFVEVAPGLQVFCPAVELALGTICDPTQRFVIGDALAVEICAEEREAGGLRLSHARALGRALMRYIDTVVNGMVVAVEGDRATVELAPGICGEITLQGPSPAGSSPRVRELIRVTIVNVDDTGPRLAPVTLPPQFLARARNRVLGARVVRVSRDSAEVFLAPGVSASCTAAELGTDAIDDATEIAQPDQAIQVVLLDEDSRARPRVSRRVALLKELTLQLDSVFEGQTVAVEPTQARIRLAPGVTADCLVDSATASAWQTGQRANVRLVSIDSGPTLRIVVAPTESPVNARLGTLPASTLPMLDSTPLELERTLADLADATRELIDARRVLAGEAPPATLSASGTSGASAPSNLNPATPTATSSSGPSNLSLASGKGVAPARAATSKRIARRIAGASAVVLIALALLLAWPVLRDDDRRNVLPDNEGPGQNDHPRSGEVSQGSLSGPIAPLVQPTKPKLPSNPSVDVGGTFVPKPPVAPDPQTQEELAKPGTDGTQVGTIALPTTPKGNSPHGIHAAPQKDDTASLTAEESVARAHASLVRHDWRAALQDIAEPLSAPNVDPTVLTTGEQILLEALYDAEQRAWQGSSGESTAERANHASHAFGEIADAAQPFKALSNNAALLRAQAWAAIADGRRPASSDLSRKLAEELMARTRWPSRGDLVRDRLVCQILHDFVSAQARLWIEALDDLPDTWRGRLERPRGEWGLASSHQAKSAISAFIDGETGTELVFVRGGRFRLGSASDGPARGSDEGPEREISVSDFYMAATEVTVEHWKRGGGIAGSFDGPQRPVRNITWNDATEWCERNGFALPSEAQWEYAASGPDNRVYPWGNAWDPGRLNSAGMHGRDQTETPCDVGSFPEGRSWCGLDDLAGNVWEWCRDGYFSNYERVLDGALDPCQDGPSSRALRGGCAYNDGTQCRTATRFPLPPDRAMANGGLRPVVDLSQH